MTVHRLGPLRILATLASTLAVFLAACSGDDDGAEGDRLADLDLSAQGRVDLGCSIHATIADRAVTDVVGDGRYNATLGLLMSSAGTEDSAEPVVEVVQQIATEGLGPIEDEEAATIDALRDELTELCSDASEVAVSPGVYADYACGIAGELEESSPTLEQLDDRLDTQRLMAVDGLARAATEDDSAHSTLHSQARELRAAALTSDEDYPELLTQVAGTCGEL